MRAENHFYQEAAMQTPAWNPQSLLAVSGSYWMTCTLHAGVKLDVFSSLAKGAKTAKDLAAALAVSPDGLERLLNALAAMGLVEKTGDAFANTLAARQYLVKDAPEYAGHMIVHHQNLVEGWSRLDEAVKTGGPVRPRSSHETGAALESFLMGMFNTAMLLAPGLARGVDLAGRKSLLDLGGGPGTYAIHFCLQNPELTARVFDLPPSERFFQKTAARFGVTDRVEFLAGDFLKDSLGGPYDVAWLSQILHGEARQDCALIVKKAVSALAPGGLVLIHEFLLDDTAASPIFATLFSLNMLQGTPGGRAYTRAELFSMLADAGAKNMRLLDFSGGPSESRIIAADV